MQENSRPFRFCCLGAAGRRGQCPSLLALPAFATAHPAASYTAAAPSKLLASKRGCHLPAEEDAEDWWETAELKSRKSPTCLQAMSILYAFCQVRNALLRMRFLFLRSSEEEKPPGCQACRNSRNAKMKVWET
eukprot:TRINITY_DN54530_c0_g1_i1.p1 TRINITY_DN54530_c0_g1~~TRINITY_DN54530_c0_g1_i1.p1  ORF type:complete len:133 (-),score=10.88 TRINITY_DN54530_c0_g1_i1:93-491(-)